MTKMMWKVHNLKSGKVVMFEEYNDAVDYLEMLKEKEVPASLNRWTWKTEIED